MLKKLEFKGVLIPEEKDPRDYNISMFIPGEDEIEDEEFSLKLPSMEIILNQKQFNSCVGHSFAIAKSILEYNHTNKWIDVDPYAIYGTRYDKEYTGMGMYSYQGAKVLKKDGAFLRRDFGIQQEVPQLINTLKEWKLNNPDKVLAAKDLTITAYYYNYNANQIKKSLKNNMPVSVAYPIYDNFYDVKDDGMVSLPTSKDKLQGYHQMTIVGWTKDKYWIVINSWGTNCGLKGMYLIPFSYEFDSAIAISDTISPIKHKAKEIEFKIGSYNFKVDNITKRFDAVPYIKSDRTYVPVRFITEALGASVEWLPDTETVIVRSEEALIELKINSRIMKVNNQKIVSDVAPIIINDRTMVPIRIIAEHLNCAVKWDGTNESVKIIAL